MIIFTEKMGIILSEIRTSEFWKFSSFLINKVLLQILLLIFPIIAGIHIEHLYTEILDNYSKLNISILWRNSELFIYIIGYLLFKYYENARRDYSGQSEQIYSTIKWMYEDLGFSENKTADIRCTLWTPMFSLQPNMKHNFERIKLKQIVNYVPDISTINNVENLHRKNRCSGRVRKIARKKNIRHQSCEAIGLVGECVVSSLEENEPKIAFESLGEDKKFKEYMIERWKFLPFEADRLTQDRRSYMALTLMDKTKSDILGVLFFDSKLESTFDKRISKKAEKYLPRIAELLVK